MLIVLQNVHDFYSPRKSIRRQYGVCMCEHTKKKFSSINILICDGMTYETEMETQTHRPNAQHRAKENSVFISVVRKKKKKIGITYSIKYSEYSYKYMRILG